MFVRDLLFSCLRRWYFVLVGLIITGGVTYFAYGLVLPSYEAKASLVLIPPSVAVTVGDNPYLYLGGLEQALGVLQVKASSPEVIAPLLDKFPDSSVTISKDATTTGPIMAISATAGTPAETMELLQDSLDLVPLTLAELQKGQNVPAASVITSMPLSMDVEPIKNSKKQIQLTAIAGVGGLAVTLLLTGFIDRLMSRPRKNKQKSESDGESQGFGPRLLVGGTSDSEPMNVAEGTRKARKRYPREKGLAESESSVDVGT